MNLDGIESMNEYFDEYVSIIFNILKEKKASYPRLYSS